MTETKRVTNALCAERRGACSALTEQKINELKQDFDEYKKQTDKNFQDFKNTIKAYFTVGFTTATAIITIVQFALTIIK